MLNKLSNNRAIALASLTAICMMAGIARGEDGGTEASMIPVAYFAGDFGGYAGSDAASCNEQRDTAWFVNELSRSEGSVDGLVPAVECRPDVLAEFSTADAD